MNDPEIPQNPMPLWVKIIIIVCCLPLLGYFKLLEYCPPGDIFVKLYPLYVPLAGYLAWKSWGRSPVITWILLALLLLTHAAMWILVKPDIL